MRSLKLTLMVVEYLKRNLSAEIVLQEEKKHWEKEKGHWEDDGYYIVRGGISVDKSYEAINERYVIDEPGEWVIDKPRIAEPDVEKRKKAKVELQQICESSKWY